MTMTGYSGYSTLSLFESWPEGRRVRWPGEGERGDRKMAGEKKIEEKGKGTGMDKELHARPKGSGLEHRVDGREMGRGFRVEGKRILNTEQGERTKGKEQEGTQGKEQEERTQGKDKGHRANRRA